MKGTFNPKSYIQQKYFSKMGENSTHPHRKEKYENLPTYAARTAKGYCLNRKKTKEEGRKDYVN